MSISTHPFLIRMSYEGEVGGGVSVGVAVDVDVGDGGFVAVG